MQQRLILLATCLLGGWLWTWSGPWLTAVDGGSGYSLWFAGQGAPAALAMLLLTGLPVLALGTIANLGGHPLSGMFVVAVGWFVLGGCGGPMDGWLLRAELPGDYRGLIVEAGLWIGLILLIALLLQWARDRCLARWPAVTVADHHGPEIRLGLPLGQAWAAGLVCAATGGVVSYVLVRGSDSGQVLGALFLSFTLGGLAAQTLFPKNRNVLIVLAAPLLLAMGAYGYVLWDYSRGEQVLAAWYRMRLPGPALALPLHYAGAGLAGVILGIGWGQGLQEGAAQTSDFSAPSSLPSSSPPPSLP